MANNPVKWSALSSVQTAAASAALKNLSNGNTALGGEIDNSSGDQLARLRMLVRGADVFHAGDYISIWFLTAVDGTNYEDGTAGTPGTIPARSPDVIIPVRLVNTQQIIDYGPVILPPCKFKTLVMNNTNHAFTNTDDENVLTFYSFNDNIVSA